ncbi:MAG: SDR family oxidoreductase [Armatimonadota bacterium]
MSTPQTQAEGSNSSLILHPSSLCLVAGATGRLGVEMVRELKRRGVRVRALVRTPSKAEALRQLADEVCLADSLKPETLGPALEGVDRVFSCLGASVIPMPQYGRVPFTRLDWPANRNLVDAAARARVRKFVYVSVFGAERLPWSDFVKGHELVVQHLRESGLDHSVLRPTGFFSAMEEILTVASHGLIPEFNGGTARTNPIHEEDLAVVCADAFDWPSGTEKDVGGPDALTRREIAQLAVTALRKKALTVNVPVGLLALGGRLVRPLNPRVGHLFTFIAKILVDDFVAPAYGRHHIADYFEQRARELYGDLTQPNLSNHRAHGAHRGGTEGNSQG